MPDGMNRSARGRSVKLFERSSRLDTALYKNILLHFTLRTDMTNLSYSLNVFFTLSTYETTPLPGEVASVSASFPHQGGCQSDPQQYHLLNKIVMFILIFFKIMQVKITKQMQTLYWFCWSIEKS